MPRVRSLWIRSLRIRSKPAPVRTESDVPEAVTVILKGKRHTVAYQPGDTLLETARTRRARCAVLLRGRELRHVHGA